MALFTDPEERAFGPAVRQLGAALRHLRLDADLPGRPPRRSSRASVDRWQCSPPRKTLFPARAVLPRAREIFPNLALNEPLEGCHVPSMAVLGRVNERILAFLAGSDET